MVHGSDSQAWERKEGGERRFRESFGRIPSGATLLKYKLTAAYSPDKNKSNQPSK